MTLTAIPQSTRAVSRAAVLGLVAALAVSGCSILDDPERDEGVRRAHRVR
ncbi:MAG: hypothetical protein ACRDWI_00110 [Jiangellaceae bacterium]